MLTHLLSGDLPRSRLLAGVLVAILLGLGLAPFLFSGARPLNTAATICVYIVLVASYDLLLGYTGIVSFAHTMFYGIGAYGIGIALARVDEPTWSVMLAGLALALLLTVALALVIGLFALRVRAIFYAMITLAVASSFAVLASQLSDFTGGEDGRTFSVPELLSPGFTLMDGELFGRAVDGKLITYYIVFFGSLLLFLFLLRLVNSPPPCPRPAGCCGWPCCPSSRPTSSPSASSASCACAADPPYLPPARVRAAHAPLPPDSPPAAPCGRAGRYLCNPAQPLAGDQ